MTPVWAVKLAWTAVGVLARALRRPRAAAELTAPVMPATPDEHAEVAEPVMPDEPDIAPAPTGGLLEQAAALEERYPHWFVFAEDARHGFFAGSRETHVPSGCVSSVWARTAGQLSDQLDRQERLRGRGKQPSSPVALTPDESEGESPCSA